MKNWAFSGALLLSGCLYWPRLIEEKAPPFSLEDCEGEIFGVGFELAALEGCSFVHVADDVTVGTGYILLITAPTTESLGIELDLKLEVDGDPQCMVSGEISEHWEFKSVANDYAVYFSDGSCSSECPPEEFSSVGIVVEYCDLHGDSVVSLAKKTKDSSFPIRQPWRTFSPFTELPGEVVVQEWAQDGDDHCFALGWFPVGDAQPRFGFVVAKGERSELVVTQTVGLMGLGGGTILSVSEGGDMRVRISTELYPWLAFGSHALSGDMVLSTGHVGQLAEWPQDFGSLARAACASR